MYFKGAACFSDASERMIAAVVYLRSKDIIRDLHIRFVSGKAKVSPLRTTIPRKELCPTVLEVGHAQFAIEKLDIQIQNSGLAFQQIKIRHSLQ